VSAAAEPRALEHFESFERQRRSALLGMWLFLANEMLLFAGLFLIAAVVRLTHPEAVVEATRHLKWWLGGINSVVLIASSLSMSVAIEAARLDRDRLVLRALLLTAAQGTLFLGLKAVEYGLEYHEGLMPFLEQPFILPDPASALYLNLYFAATGLHSLHLAIGVGLVLAIAWRTSRPGFLRRKPTHIEVVGLYWHFIDLIWVMLFATIYLANR
jgi:cytochrome c oxidase subunit 3